MKMSFANACKTYYKKYTIRKNPSHKLKIKENVSSVISETCAGANKKTDRPFTWNRRSI